MSVENCLQNKFLPGLRMVLIRIPLITVKRLLIFSVKATDETLGQKPKKT